MHPSLRTYVRHSSPRRSCFMFVIVCLFGPAAEDEKGHQKPLFASNLYLDLNLDLDLNMELDQDLNWIRSGPDLDLDCRH